MADAKATNSRSISDQSDGEERLWLAGSTSWVRLFRGRLQMQAARSRGSLQVLV